MGDWHYLDVGLIRAVMGEIQRVVPNSYQVVSTDLWSDNTFGNNLHPNCKFEQGERAAILAAAVNGEGGKTMVQGNGPVLVSIEILEGGKKAVLTYENVGTGLTTTNGGTEVKGFQLISRTYRVDPRSKVTATITAPNQITIEATADIVGLVFVSLKFSSLACWCYSNIVKSIVTIYTKVKCCLWVLQKCYSVVTIRRYCPRLSTCPSM